MTAATPSTEQAVLKALASRPELTAAEVAAATGRGRSTVAKALAELERAGEVRRSPGAKEGARRSADRWSPACENPGAREGGTGERLRPGQLDELVLAYLREHQDAGPVGPTTVAKGLGRSSGAVGNCLARLAAAGQIRQVSEKPRRYRLAAERSQEDKT
jgi:DNA-binding IclR family transcriptional regulator